MTASMLLMIKLANTSRRAFGAYAIAYAVVFIVFMQLVNLHVVFKLPLHRLLSPRGPAILVKHLRSESGTDGPSVLALSVLDRYPKLALPLATFGDPEVEKYVVSRGQLVPEYYVAIVGVYTPAALDRKLQDVAKAEYLLVPRTLATPAEHDPCQGHLQDIRRWFLYPARFPCRAKPLDPLATVTRFISQHYIPVESVGPWLILRRTSAIPSS
jgi:hypothetical protein